VPTLCIRVAADLDLQCGAAVRCWSTRAYQAKNGFNRFGFGFVANPGLAPNICQTVQRTGIQIESQSQSFFRAAIPTRIPILLE